MIFTITHYQPNEVGRTRHADSKRERADIKTSRLSERETAANTQLDPINHGPERFATGPECGEGAARAALDSRAGRALTDADWAVAKDRLLEFFAILRDWDRRARRASRDLVMCEVPCLPEL